MIKFEKFAYEAPVAASTEMEPQCALCQSGTINDMTVNSNIDGDLLFD